MKSAKNLLIPSIVMIILAIGVGVFFVIDKSIKARTVETTYNLVDLLYISPVDIASVSVAHRDGKINVKVDRTIKADGSILYVYSGSDKGNEKYSQADMEAFLTTMNSFVSCASISENANLSEYGLDNPAYTVTISKTDGTQKVILIGDKATDGSGCYVCAAGSTSVYLAGDDKIFMASMTGNDFIDDRLIDVEIKELETVAFSRKKDSISVSGSAVYDESSDMCSIKFNKPFEISSSVYFDKLIKNICELSVAGYEDATNGNLSKFGLAIPPHQITLGFKEGKTYTLDLSTAIDGYYYGRINGSGKIFKADASKIEIIESPLLSLISDYIFHNPCDEIDSVEVSGIKGKFTLKVDVKKQQAISDRDSNVFLDGRNAKVTNASGRNYAAMLYETIFGINIGGVEEHANIPESAVADTSIKVYDHNHSAVVYDFFRRSDETFYVVKNGEYTGFYVFKRELYNDGGQDTYNYGIWPAYEILTKAITDGINGIYEIPDGK